MKNKTTMHLSLPADRNSRHKKNAAGAAFHQSFKQAIQRQLRDGFAFPGITQTNGTVEHQIVSA